MTGDKSDLTAYSVAPVLEVGDSIKEVKERNKTRKQILDLLQKREDLPSFPDLLMKIQEKITDQNTGIRDISKLIELDAALSGNILKLANSAFYSGVQPVETIISALSKLGLERIKQYIFSLELSRLFKDDTVISYFKFWRHSLSVALFTQSLSHYRNIPGPIREMAYLSGLMHDIGIMVFAYLIPGSYSAFLEEVVKHDATLEVQEKKAFGIDHQELGALFIERWWKINIRIINAVRYHHSPFESDDEDRLCTQLVNLANGICNNQGFTHGLASCYDTFKEGSWDGLGLTLANVDKILEEVNQSMTLAMELLGYSG